MSGAETDFCFALLRSCCAPATAAFRRRRFCGRPMIATDLARRFSPPRQMLAPRALRPVQSLRERGPPWKPHSRRPAVTFNNGLSALPLG
jgi:hypothetical protein